MSALAKVEMHLVVADRLAVLTEQANAAAEAHLNFGRRSLSEARRCGQLLIEIKALVGHGHFMAWVRERCRFSHDSAELYMRLADAYADDIKFRTIQNLTIRAALRMAAESREARTPPPTDPRQLMVFSEGEAPIPPDAGSRLLAQGVLITGDTDSARKMKRLFKYLKRVRPWEFTDLDIEGFDASTLAEIAAVAQPLIPWLKATMETAMRARRPPIEGTRVEHLPKLAGRRSGGDPLR